MGDRRQTYYASISSRVFEAWPRAPRQYETSYKRPTFKGQLRTELYRVRGEDRRYPGMVQGV